PLRGPELLAVDDELVAVEYRPGLEAGQVATGAGFGEALAPDLGPRLDAGEMPLLLRCPEPHEGGGDVVDTEYAGQARGAELGQHRLTRDLVHDAEPAPAVLVRPVRSDPPDTVKRALPVESGLERVVVPPLGSVLGEQLFDLLRQFGGGTARGVVP